MYLIFLLPSSHYLIKYRRALNNFQGVGSKTASNKVQKHPKETFLKISVPADRIGKICFSIFLKQKESHSAVILQVLRGRIRLRSPGILRKFRDFLFSLFCFSFLFFCFCVWQTVGVPSGWEFSHPSGGNWGVKKR